MTVQITRLQSPIDRVAARVTSKGYSYKPAKKLQEGESALPIPTRQPARADANNPSFPGLVGVKFGRLTVVGIAAEVRSRWVCRCTCGMYLLRTAKAILNPANAQDRCGECRHLAFLKREEHFRQYGTHRDF